MCKHKEIILGDFFLFLMRKEDSTQFLQESESKLFPYY